MSGSQVGLAVVLVAVLVIFTAGVAFFIGWSVGYDYGQDEMCAQMSNAWQWQECR